MIPKTNRSLRLLLWLAFGMFLWGVLRAVAFQPRGETTAYFAAQVARSPQVNIPWPPPHPSGSTATEPLNSLTVDIWFLDAPETFDAQTIFAERIERGRTHAGPAYYVEFSEAGLSRYLTYWFGQWARQSAQVRDARVELKPGGLILYGEIPLGQRWQRIGAVFHLDESGRQLVFAGVDVDGQLLASPPVGPIAAAIKVLEESGNRALRELRVIDPEGVLAIQQIVLLEDQARVLLR